MTNWNDTPPTVAGTYWVRRRVSGRESIGKLLSPREWFINGSDVYTPERAFQFGHRLPTNDELAQIDRERTALCEVATLCMNTRAIMPEFREISDYTEVVDVLGAFLERLGELPGLIEEYGLLCKAYGLALQSLGSDERWGLRKMRDEILDKINAILGVPNDA